MFITFCTIHISGNISGYQNQSTNSTWCGTRGPGDTMKIFVNGHAHFMLQNSSIVQPQYLYARGPNMHIQLKCIKITLVRLCEPVRSVCVWDSKHALLFYRAGPVTFGLLL